MNGSGNPLSGIERTAIIGTGLLGASVGLGLKAAGVGGTIVGIGRRRETVERARSRGAVDEVAETTEAVAGAGLVIVAVPLGAFDRVFEQMAAHVGPGAVVTDVGSTKADVVASAQRRLRAPGRFVGAHPMAGKEQQGPEAATADLFRGKPCVLTPHEGAEADAIATVEALWRSLGMTLLRMTPSEHDRQTAVVSHLPHLAAVMLVRVAAEQGGWEVASTGFRDTTRLASSNPPMRADIITANRDAILEALGAMREQIDGLSRVIEDGDGDALRAKLESAKASRDRWLAERERGG